MIEGAKSNFYTDVKTLIIAGMEFCYKKGETKNNKCMQIGYDLVRIYFDSKDKDLTIGQQRIKRVFE
jgi:hypothetical protein